MSEHASSQIDAAQTQGQRYDPLIGQTLDGRYKIERVLGEGGMGIVYKAVHTTLGKPLAIKVLRPEVSKNEEIVQRFRQEAQSASQIGNPHIIDISDFGTLADGSTYFVMEFLTGKSLTVAQLEGKFSLARTIHVVRQLAGALGAAHDIGIVHRDLKPDNVQLVERGGQKDFVKVLDFGIAKVGGSTSKLTQAGQVFGTPHYMSPEQCAGTNVDHRTDIYAVGVMLYEMACSKVPFDADNLMGILTKHLYENPIAPHELAPPVDVPPALEAVILKCLQKKPEARYQTMAELSADLDAIERGQAPRAVIDKVERATSGPQTLTGVEARVSIGTGQQDIAIRKSRAPLFIGAGVGVALVIGVIAATMSKQAPGAPQADAAKPAAPPTAEPAAVQPTAAANPPPAPVVQPPKAPPPAVEVKVTVSSVPENAEVYLDGSLVGNTPFPIVKPAADKASVKLELRLPGYENKSVVISARSNDVAVTLKKVEEKAAAHPAPAPRPAKRSRSESAREERSNHGGGSQTEVLDPWN
jgi:eukaryotic-like serine/threonine-protein kinase